MRDTYHFTGIAGVGMNALAQVVLARGWRVTGSDRYADRGLDLEVLAQLRRLGAAIVPQDGAAVNERVQAVVVSTAIEADNPDWVAARRQQIPVLHRAELLAALVAGHECIAITGTSGKTTTTGIIGWLLEQLGEDPTVVNGGVVLNWAGPERIGNVRLGAGRRWVVEADESDRSLLRFNPVWAVITNLSADHFSLAETETLFAEFRRQVTGGIVEGAELANLWRARPPVVTASGSRFEYGGTPFTVPLAGRHNAANALLAVILCERLGYPLSAVRDALAGFKGIQRRLEQVAAGSIRVYDDYAHNPAKITAAWQTVADGHRRVLGMWRPHGFAPLRQMRAELAAAFAAVCRSEDRLFLLPVYYAGGTATKAVDSAALAEDVAQRGVRVSLAPDYERLEDDIARLAAPGDAVLVMGARDPELPRCARRLAARLGG
jgi:UDP-N-acetylmuramate--alanine ligase